MPSKGYYTIIIMGLLILALPMIVYGQPLGNEKEHDNYNGSLIIAGSYDRLSIILPGEDNKCNLEINSATITNLTIYIVEGCNNSNIMIINSKINYLILFPAGGVVQSTIIRNSTIIQSSIKWSTELVITNSKLGTVRSSATTIHLKNSVFGDVTIDYAFELVVVNSTGQHLTADLGIGYNYTNLRINGLVMRCRDIRIPGYTDKPYSVELGGPYTSLTISSIGGEGHITNTVFTCPEGYSFMSINGFGNGYISGLVMNSTNSSFAWIGFNPGILNIEDSEIYGNITILLSASKEITLYMQNATVTYSFNTTLPSRITIENTTLGHIARRGNATKLPVISEMITAENIEFDIVQVNAMTLNLYSANITINGSKINVRSLNLYRPGNLIINNSVINSGFTAISAYTSSRYIINKSIINSNLIVESSNGILDFKMIDSALQGDRVFALHLLNSTIKLNITNSRIDRVSKISIVGYPPWKSQAYFYTTYSYYGSLLGPRIMINDSEVRPGGATIEFIAVNAAYIINTWYGDAGLHILFNRASDQVFVTPINGSIVPAVMKDNETEVLVYLLKLPQPVNKLYLTSNYEVNLSVMINNRVVNTIIGHGLLELDLPASTDEVVIIPNKIRPIKTPTANTTASIAHTFLSTTTGNETAPRSETPLQARILTGAAIIVIVLVGLYILMRDRRSYS